MKVKGVAIAMGWVLCLGLFCYLLGTLVYVATDQEKESQAADSIGKPITQLISKWSQPHSVRSGADLPAWGLEAQCAKGYSFFGNRHSFYVCVDREDRVIGFRKVPSPP